MPRVGLATYDLLLFPQDDLLDQDAPEGIVYVHGVSACDAESGVADHNVVALLTDITQLRADRDTESSVSDGGLSDLFPETRLHLGWYALLSEEMTPPGGVSMLGMYALLGAESSNEPGGELIVTEIGARDLLTHSPHYAKAIAALMEALVRDARGRYGRHAETLVVYSEAPSDAGTQAMQALGFELDVSLPGFTVAVTDLLRAADSLLRGSRIGSARLQADA